MTYKVKILIIGPPGCGKSKLANFLSDMNISLPENFKLMEPLRILEFDLNYVEVNDRKSNVDVQLWDVNGNDKYTPYWPFYRKNIDGILFVCSTCDDNETQVLESMYNFFVAQNNINFRACLACSMSTDRKDLYFPPSFSKISQVTVNLESRGEKFKQEFSKYITSVLSTLYN